MITYIGGDFGLHGLNIKKEDELRSLIEKIRKSLREIHPSLRFDSDVEFEITEQAGDFEK